MLKTIAAGGFGVIHLAKHPRYGTVAYKELISSFIQDPSKFVYYYSCCYIYGHWFMAGCTVSIAVLS